MAAPVAGGGRPAGLNRLTILMSIAGSNQGADTFVFDFNAELSYTTFAVYVQEGLSRMISSITNIILAALLVLYQVPRTETHVGDS